VHTSFEQAYGVVVVSCPAHAHTASTGARGVVVPFGAYSAMFTVPDNRDLHGAWADVRSDQALHVEERDGAFGGGRDRLGMGANAVVVEAAQHAENGVLRRVVRAAAAAACAHYHRGEGRGEPSCPGASPHASHCRRHAPAARRGKPLDRTATQHWGLTPLLHD
jgi:hypothetical protein